MTFDKVNWSMRAVCTTGNNFRLHARCNRAQLTDSLPLAQWQTKAMPVLVGELLSSSEFYESLLHAGASCCNGHHGFDRKQTFVGPKVKQLLSPNFAKALPAVLLFYARVLVTFGFHLCVSSSDISAHELTLLLTLHGQLQLKLCWDHVHKLI